MLNTVLLVDASRQPIIWQKWFCYSKKQKTTMRDPETVFNYSKKAISSLRWAFTFTDKAVT